MLDGRPDGREALPERAEQRVGILVVEARDDVDDDQGVVHGETAACAASNPTVAGAGQPSGRCAILVG